MAAKAKHVEHENHERWLVSYADFITLLFAFFVVLYATSTQNKEKEKSFENALKEKLAFITIGGAGAGLANGVYTSAGSSVGGQVIEGIDVFPKKGGPAEVMEFVDRQLKKKFTPEDRARYIRDISIEPIGVRISLQGDGFFTSGSHKMKPESLAGLNKVAQILKASEHQVLVEGHTDKEDVTSEAGNIIETNWELGALRATTIVRYLIKIQGIAANRLAAVSYGDQRPLELVGATADQLKQAQRRIDFVILNED